MDPRPIAAMFLSSISRASWGGFPPLQKVQKFAIWPRVRFRVSLHAEYRAPHTSSSDAGPLNFTLLPVRKGLSALSGRGPRGSSWSSHFSCFSWLQARPSVHFCNACRPKNGGGTLVLRYVDDMRSVLEASSSRCCAVWGGAVVRCYLHKGLLDLMLGTGYGLMSMLQGSLGDSERPVYISSPRPLLPRVFKVTRCLPSPTHSCD
ncbi:hypothetical protein C8Q78DRAFT_413122 [Trametes maxima]|nr:hypothetical protein C8Q78DRAFT_413122 [Trametes maxima]